VALIAGVILGPLWENRVGAALPPAQRDPIIGSLILR
jgi:hypothetical protein